MATATADALTEKDREKAQEWVGRVAPSFVLPDTEGNEVNLAAVLGQKPVVLVFYRGVW
ncbi:MAG: hypothetical protein OHK0029_11640 [Armatimonadaceae bacterium]